MDMRKVISAIVVAVVLIGGAAVAYMYIADVGVFNEKKKEKEVELTPKDSKLGEFGEDGKDKEPVKGADDGDEGTKEGSSNSDEDDNSDIVSALPDGESDDETVVTDVKVSEGDNGTDRVTADTGNGNSVDVFIPGQSTNSEPVVSTEKPSGSVEVDENSGANKNTEKVKDLIDEAGATYSGDVSTGSFGVSGDGIRHVFAVGEEDDYYYSYSVGWEYSSKSLQLAADNMIRLGVKASRSEIINSLKRAFEGEVVDFGNAWAVSGGYGVMVRWN